MTPMSWHLCSIKPRHNRDQQNFVDEVSIYAKGATKISTYPINIPSYGTFERQIEFRGYAGFPELVRIYLQILIKSNGFCYIFQLIQFQNVCKVPLTGTNSIPLIMYKLNVFRECN